MSDAPPPFDSAASGGLAQGKPSDPVASGESGGPPAPPPAAPEPAAPPKSRTWFVALAWVTLVLFTLFVIAITAAAVAIPQLRKANRERGAVERPDAAARR